MVAKSRTMRIESLERLLQELHSCDSVFLSPDDFQKLGIQASQIDMTEDGGLHFDPCFFQPHPERVLEKYPLDLLNMEQDMEPLNLEVDFNDILEECLEVCPDVDEAIELAIWEFNIDIQLHEGDWLAHSYQTWVHIDCLLNADDRKGLSKSLSLSDLAPPRVPGP
jgi:hypothetical protein